MILEQLFRCELYDIPKPAIENLNLLLTKLQHLEYAYGFPFMVTSGFRTWAEHKSTYRTINDRRIIQKKPELPIPIHSQHLLGNAADIFDPKGELKAWVVKNMDLIESLDLYMEAFKYTENWVHVQKTSPASGSRFFIP